MLSKIRLTDNRKRLGVTILIWMLASVLITIPFLSPAVGQTNEQLAARYAPVLHFTSGEMFYPVSVEYFIDNSEVANRDTGAIVDSSPQGNTLGRYTSGSLYLDNTLETLDAIAADYSANEADLGYTAYVHVVSGFDQTVIQYWLFYVYNNGPLNNHQGDWEVIQVFLDTAGNPETLLLSQHGAGENARWSDVEQVDGHPVVYVAQGSHANYFRAYQGKLGIESDIVGSDGKTINPESLELVMLGEAGSHPASQSWLDFAGRWGYWGTDEEVVLGRAGPYGPVFNQNGARWDQPESYLSSTLTVDGSYFILAWLVANFLVLFLIYIVVRAAWKSWGIFRLHTRDGGIRTLRLFRGRGLIGLALTIAALVVTLAALFLPWYTITASSEAGPLAQNTAPLMSINGVNGVQVYMFLGTGNSDAPGGFTPLFSLQFPFLILFAAGVILTALDIIGIRSRRSFSRKLWIGIIGVLLPVIFVLIFVAILPALLPYASGLFPGQGIPPQVEAVVRNIASSPAGGRSVASFPVAGATIVTWGLAIGSMLFIVAAVLRLVAGLVMYSEPKEVAQPAAWEYPPPPPPPELGPPPMP